LKNLAAVGAADAAHLANEITRAEQSWDTGTVIGVLVGVLILVAVLYGLYVRFDEGGEIKTATETTGPVSPQNEEVS
jgi:hypothetical protein